MSHGEQDGPGGRHREFPSTRWSVVSSAGREPSVESRRALAELCSMYWPAIYSFLRRRGHRPEDAEDLTQGFVASLIDRNPFGELKRARGRFRSFLLVCLRNFISSEWARAHRAKRGGTASPVSIDAVSEEERLHLEPADARSPEALYERRWALSVLEAARNKLRDEFVSAHKLEVFEHLACYVDAAAVHVSYEVTAHAMEKTPGAVKVAVHRLRQRYGELLREVVCETVDSPEELDDELHHLMAALRGA